MFELSFLWPRYSTGLTRLQCLLRSLHRCVPVPVCCRVTEVAPPAITLAPHPDVAVHPLSYQRALRRAQRLQAAAAAGDEAEAEEDSDDEGGLGCC